MSGISAKTYSIWNDGIHVEYGGRVKTSRIPRNSNWKGWGTIKTSPKGTSDVFTNQLVPLAKSLTGSLSLWEALSKEQVQGLVDTIYGSAQHTVQDALIDPWGPLISYCLNNWCNGFGTKAAEGLKRYIKINQAELFNNHQVITDWVQFSLTPDGNPPTYPFLWKE
ncbi:hypothetical protein BYT27DRAFT_7260232 [Phlegmacium glaucopus]|nr:hypothetical protein BYT27DRAFT_7260232 [Phlegmacium glaucopus]